MARQVRLSECMSGEGGISAHLICCWRFLAMASGSIWRPSRKEPTVCPAGLGGRRASRAGPGLAFFSRISCSTPAMMLPPFFSRSYTYAHGVTSGVTADPERGEGVMVLSVCISTTEKSKGQTTNSQVTAC